MRPFSDLQYLGRSWARSPWQALAVWACTVAWFTAGPAFLALLGVLHWRSLPFPGADRIVWVHGGFDLVPALAATGRFESVGHFEEGWIVVETKRGAATAAGAMVDEGFFDSVALRPLWGRVFAPHRGASDVGGAVLTRGLCQRLFGRGDPPIGAVLHSGGRPLVLLGVVPDQPVFPPRAEIWVLASSGIRPDFSFFPRELMDFGMVARLAPGTSVQAATTTTLQVARDFEKRTNILQGDVIGVETLEQLLRRISSGERGILTVALAGLGLFLLLAYTSALAGFVVERQGEIAVRIAFGASRLALIRLLILQAVLIAVPGCVVGIPIAAYVLGKLSQPRLDAGSLSLSVGIWAAVVLTSTLLVWGSAPQLGLTSLLVPDRTEAKRTRPQARVRLGLVCVALSLAVALGATTAVLRESLANRERIPLGFEPRNMALWVIGIAVLIGLAIYLPASQALRVFLFGVDALSPTALFEAVLMVAGAALAAATLASATALRRLSYDLLKRAGPS